VPKGAAKEVDPLEWAKAYLTKDEYAQLLSALEEPLDASIRINTLKWETASAALKLAERYGWALERVPFCKDGFWIRGGKLSPSATIEHRLGYYYIQEAASMLPPTLHHPAEKPPT